MEEFTAYAWRGLTLASTIYCMLLAIGVIARFLYFDTHAPERVLHVVALAISWFIGRVYLVVDTMDRWYIPLTGARVSLALTSNVWAILGLHIIWRRLGRQKAERDAAAG